jgi:hypothetical protein
MRTLAVIVLLVGAALSFTGATRACREPLPSDDAGTPSLVLRTWSGSELTLPAALAETCLVDATGRIDCVVSSTK